MTHELTFGVFVPQGWKMELASIADPQAKWAKAVEVAQLAEELGFDSLWVYDHFHNVPVPAHETMFECWTTLAAISQLTSRIKLGQMVGCAPYRNPGLLAKITSNIDVISGGRLIWGIGAGWYEHEFTGYGYEFPKAVRPHPRAARDGRDREGDVDGARRQLRGQALHARRRAVRSRSRCSSRTRRSSSAAAASSSRCASWPATPTRRTSAASRTSGSTRPRCCSSTARTSAATTTRSGRRSRPRCSSARPSRRSSTPARRSFWGEPVESWRAGNLVGTPEQVAEKVQTYVDLGCTGFYPWCSDYPDTETLRLFAQVADNLR